MVDRLVRAAAQALEEALAQRHALHLPGARTLHRERLERALDLAGQVLALADASDVAQSTIRSVRLIAVTAHAARAQDARHGAGQLSQSAQRAPTTEDCAQGWAQVEAIVAKSEASAREAAALALLLDEGGAHAAARSAAAAAQDARRIVEERNHAYTFHTDPKFSFGEGWYVAAAGVLASVDIQIEPAQPQTAAAERFLRDAGLGGQLVPYRSRPRANKALPALIARAFSLGAQDAQRAVRAAFVGDAAVASEIAGWADEALARSHPARKKVLVWVRRGVHHPTRNSSDAELAALCRLAAQHELVPVLIGDAAPSLPPGALDMTLFWRLPLFQGDDMRRAQLQLFEHLRRAHGLLGQVGVTTAGMDGPALMGLPTMYLTDAPNPRLGRWVGAVPDYQEVVRGEDYLEQLSRTLSRWARAAHEPRVDPGSGAAGS